MIRKLAMVLAAGAVLWLVKVAQIAANGGENTTEGLVGATFLLGLACLFFGSTSVGLLLTEGRGVAVKVLAALASIVAFWVSFSLIDTAMQALVGDAGPQWVHDEMGIVATAVVWLAISLWVVARTGALLEPEPA